MAEEWEECDEMSAWHGDLSAVMELNVKGTIERKCSNCIWYERCEENYEDPDRDIQEAPYGGWRGTH